MLDILDQYLSDATTPELKESIRQAHDLFDLYGMDQRESYEDGFVELLMTSQNTDSGKLMEEIYNLTRSLQFKILQEHQLIINEDAPPSVLNIFLAGLLRLPTYDDAQTLFSLLNMTGDTMEIIAECIALVMGDSPDHLHTFIENASDRVLQDMAMHLDRVSFTASDEAFVLKGMLIAHYKHFVHISGIAQLKLAHLITNGLDVGHPFRVYLNLLGGEFELMEAKSVAEELVAMAIISSDAADNPRGAIHENLELFVSDIDKITKIEIEVGNLLLKLNAHEQA